MPHGGEGPNGGHTTPIFDHSNKDKNWDGWGKNGNPDRPPRKDVCGKEGQGIGLKPDS